MSTLTLSGGHQAPGIGPHRAVLAWLALLPFVPVLVAPWVGYDVLTVRGAVVLAEVAFVLALALPSRWGEVWRAVPGWARLACTVWVVWMGVTSVTALHPGPAVLRTAEWIAHGAFAAAVWQAAHGSEDRKAEMARWIGGSVLWLCLGAMVWWCAKALHGGGPTSYAGPLAGARNVGVYALMGLAFWLAAMPAGRPRAGWWLLWGLGWAVLAWSGGRASLVAGMLLVAAWGVLARPGWTRAAGLSAAGVGGMLASLPLPHDAGTGLLQLVARSAAVGDGYASGRAELWAHVLSAWADRPWLGLGGDGPAFALADHTYAHNTVVQALGEWGLVGAAAFGAGLLGITWALVAVAWRRRTPVLAALAAGWLAASANGLLDGVFYGALSLALLAAMVGIGLAPRTAETQPIGRTAPLTTGAVVAVLALVAGLAGLHMAASAARFAAGSPAPTSFQARLALSTSTTYRQTELLWWGKDWAAEHPDAALRAARWGQRHSRTPWAFLSLEADLRIARGDSAGAERLWRAAAEQRAQSFPVQMAAVWDRMAADAPATPGR